MKFFNLIKTAIVKAVVFTTKMLILAIILLVLIILAHSVVGLFVT